MQEVIKEIEGLYTLLQKKTEEADSKAAELRNFEIVLSNKTKKLKATSNALGARERIQSNYESIEKEKESIKVRSKELDEWRTALNVIETDLRTYRIVIDKDRKELSKMVSVYSKKVKDIAQLRKELLEERKNMKASILEELAKKVK